MEKATNLGRKDGVELDLRVEELEDVIAPRRRRGFTDQQWEVTMIYFGAALGFVAAT